MLYQDFLCRTLGIIIGLAIWDSAVYLAKRLHKAKATVKKFKSHPNEIQQCRKREYSEEEINIADN